MSTLQDPTSTVARPRVANSALPSAPALVTIEAVKPGVWLVRSSDDRFGGTFLCPKAALKFVRDETAAVQGAVVVALVNMAMRKKSPHWTFMTAGQGLKPAA